MTGFDLPKNFQEDPDAILRRVRSRLVPPQQTLLITDPAFVRSLPLSNGIMANKTIREFSAPSAANVAPGRTIIDGDANCKLKLMLVTMVQAQDHDRNHQPWL